MLITKEKIQDKIKDVYKNICKEWKEREHILKIDFVLFVVIIR